MAASASEAAEAAGEEGPLGRGLARDGGAGGADPGGHVAGGKKNPGGAIFVLENASLEVGKVGKTMQLLNCDDHAGFLRKHRKDPAQYRPDISHQALLAILDSPLNKAGLVRSVFVHTKKRVLFEVDPQVRIPRTFKRFSGLMSQLLQKLSIRASGGPSSKKLLRVIKSPVTKHLPVSNCRRVGFSRSAPKMRNLAEFCQAIDIQKNETVVFVVGAMSHGKIDTDWVDEMISISAYPLSAACCLSKITNNLEARYNIV